MFAMPGHYDRVSFRCNMGAPTYISDTELEHIKLHVTYDMNTGEFRPTDLYLRTGGRAIMFGVERRTGRGHTAVHIFDKVYMAHRLAWAMVYGDTHSPIYHKNGIMNDNRINNLTRAKRAVKPIAWQGKIG